MLIEIDASGYMEIDLDEETKHDQWGNDWTEVYDKIMAREISFSELVFYHLDSLVSDMEIEHEMKVYDGGGVEIVLPW